MQDTSSSQNTVSQTSRGSTMTQPQSMHDRIAHGSLSPDVALEPSKDVAVNKDISSIQELIQRQTIVRCYPSNDIFLQELASGRRMRFYIGFDATAKTLHLSHAKNFMVLEAFRKLGHEVIVLFGDFTARIGDPTGSASARSQLSREQVLENVSRWKELIKPLMDFTDAVNPPLIQYNHTWLASLTFEDVMTLAGQFTVQQMIERDMFKKRMANEQPIHLHEFLYPLMQGFDSVAMNVDVELCGTDQTFNALAGRTLQRKLRNKEKYVVTVTLMENPKTGELMSKSKGIGVFLGTNANDLYGQIMAQPDEMTRVLFTHLTWRSQSEIDALLQKRSPRDAKMDVAIDIVERFHGRSAAHTAQETFVRTVSKKEVPLDMPSYTAAAGDTVSDVLIACKLASSTGEVRRLLQQRGLKLDGVVLSDAAFATMPLLAVHHEVNENTATESRGVFASAEQNAHTQLTGMVLQKGKRQFVRVRWER